MLGIHEHVLPSSSLSLCATCNPFAVLSLRSGSLLVRSGAGQRFDLEAEKSQLALKPYACAHCLKGEAADSREFSDVIKPGRMRWTRANRGLHAMPRVRVAQSTGITF